MPADCLAVNALRRDAYVCLPACLSGGAGGVLRQGRAEHVQGQRRSRQACRAAHGGADARGAPTPSPDQMTSAQRAARRAARSPSTRELPARAPPSTSAPSSARIACSLPTMHRRSFRRSFQASGLAELEHRVAADGQSPPTGTAAPRRRKELRQVALSPSAPRWRPANACTEPCNVTPGAARRPRVARFPPASRPSILTAARRAGGGLAARRRTRLATSSHHLRLDAGGAIVASMPTAVLSTPSSSRLAQSDMLFPRRLRSRQSRAATPPSPSPSLRHPISDGRSDLRAHLARLFWRPTTSSAPPPAPPPPSGGRRRAHCRHHGRAADGTRGLRPRSVLSRALHLPELRAAAGRPRISRGRPDSTAGC